MTSYNSNEDAPHEPDGVVLVWNMKFKKMTPEYIFHCQVSHVYFSHKYYQYKVVSIFIDNSISNSE